MSTMASLYRRLWRCSLTSLWKITANGWRLATESTSNVIQRARTNRCTDCSGTLTVSRVRAYKFFSSVRMLPPRDADAHVEHFVTTIDCQGNRELVWPFLRQPSEKWLQALHHCPKDQAVITKRASSLVQFRTRPDLNQQTQLPGAPPNSISPIQTTCAMTTECKEVPAHTYTIPEEARADDDLMKLRILAVEKVKKQSVQTTECKEVPAHTYTIPEEARADDGLMKLRILAVEKVQPAVSRPHEYLPLSNLDRLLSSMYPQTFFVFESTRWRSVENVACALKRTLAEVLVHYYPFAGEMKEPECGLYKIHCNGVGADFTEAYLDASIKDIDVIFPNRSFAYKFLPTPNLAGPVLCPLSVKITRFRCGGLLLGCSFHHQVADFQSFLIFVQAWTQAMRGQQITTLPYHERSLLKAKPRRQIPFKNHELEYRVQQREEKRMPRPAFLHEEKPILSKCFHLNAGTILELKRIATVDGKYGPFTASVCAAAFFWRLIMRANGCYRQEQVAKIVCSIDGRRRMHDPQVPENYFGNVVGLSCSAATIGELQNEPLRFAAGLIHQNMQRAMASDQFRSLIDWVEAQKPLPVNPNFNIFSDPVLICSSLINAPLYDVDFGLGRHPDFVGYGAMPDGVQNVLWLQPSPHGRGNIMAQVHLRADSLCRLENDPEFDLVSSSDYMNESFSGARQECAGA